MNSLSNRLQEAYRAYRIGTAQRNVAVTIPDGSAAVSAGTHFAVAEPRAFRFRILDFDFVPVSGTGYDLKCTKAVVRWEDVRLFRPTLKIDKPFDGADSLCINLRVRRHRAWLPDQTIGWLVVFIERGKTEPDPDTGIHGLTGNGGAPQNAPSAGYVTNGFYLCCTRKCKVKGSVGKDGNRARIHLDVHGPPNIVLGLDDGAVVLCDGEGKESSSHDVSCS